MKSNYSFSQTVNRFIKSISKHNDTISVFNNGNETVIIYEDWEHEPIINYTSVFKEYKRTAEQRKTMSDAQKQRYKCDNEALQRRNENISKAMKDRDFSELHKARLSSAKTKYYKDLKDGKVE
jgi:membrane-associated HD superfamily phosphohydrolase